MIYTKPSMSDHVNYFMQSLKTASLSCFEITYITGIKTVRHEQRPCTIYI